MTISIQQSPGPDPLFVGRPEVSSKAIVGLVMVSLGVAVLFVGVFRAVAFHIDAAQRLKMIRGLESEIEKVRQEQRESIKQLRDQLQEKRAELLKAGHSENDGDVSYYNVQIGAYNKQIEEWSIPTEPSHIPTEWAESIRDQKGILVILVAFMMAGWILGVAAIWDIRKSEGKVRGMGLAVIDVAVSSVALLVYIVVGLAVV